MGPFAQAEAVRPQCVRGSVSRAGWLALGLALAPLAAAAAPEVGGAGGEGAPASASAQGREERQEEGEAQPASRRRLPAVRVTAIRPAELSEDPSSFVTVIVPEQYAGEEKTVEALLGESVGVQVRSFGGPGQRSEISIRGSTGQQVVVLLDGVRLNTAQSGTVDLGTLPLAWVERIEVSRGGGGPWAGSGAIGGVVNVVTRKPGAGPVTTASLSGGSSSTWRGSLAHSDSVGRGDYGFAYDGFATNGNWHFQSIEVDADLGFVPSRELLRINNDAQNHALLLQGGLDVAPGVRLRATDQLFYGSRGQPGPDTNARDPNGGQHAHAREHRTRNVGALRIEADELEAIAEGLYAEGFVSYLYERSHFYDPIALPGSTPIDVRQKNRAWSLHSEVGLERDALGAAHLGSAVLDLRYDSLSGNEEGFHRRVGAAVGLQDEIGFWADRVRVVPGVRLDYTEGHGAEWIPRVGLVLSPRPWLRLKANGERSYRAPVFDELFFPDKGFIRGNPHLRAERAWNADVGLEVGLAELGVLQQLRLEVAVFVQDIQNSIVFQRINQFTVAPTNTNDATVRGLELKGSFELFGWAAVSANWTLQDAELEQAQVPVVPEIVPPLVQTPGNALPGRAESEYHLRLRVGPPSGLFKVVAERSFTSKIHPGFNDDFTLSSRAVYDLSGSVDVVQLWQVGGGEAPAPTPAWLPERLLARVSVLNLTDQSVRDSVGFPQPGRTFTFGLEGQW